MISSLCFQEETVCVFVCVCVHWNNAAWQIFEDSSSPALADPSPAAAQVAVVVVVIVQLGIGYKHIIRSLVCIVPGLVMENGQ